MEIRRKTWLMDLCERLSIRVSDSSKY